MKTSKQLREFIKSQEKFESKPYKDVTGKVTVGYGDTHGDMTSVTEQEALRRMENRIAIGEKELAKRITRTDLRQGQIDALADMEYNMGIGELVSTGLIDAVNAGDDEKVYQSIFNYTKAKSAKTGQLEEYPGLVKRAQERARMWKESFPSVSGEMQAEEAPNENDFSDMGDFSQTVNEEEFSDMNSYAAQVRPAPAATGTEALELSSYIANEEDLLQMSEASAIAKDFGLNPEEVRAVLKTKPSAQLRVELEHPDIVKGFPAVARWASRPENYTLLRKTGDWSMKVEVATKPLRKGEVNKFTGVADRTLKELEQSALHIQMFLGGVEKSQGVRALRILDKQIQEIQDSTSSERARLIQQKMSEVPESFTKAGEGFSDLLDAMDNDYQGAVEAVKKTWDGSAESLDSVLELLGQMAKDPAAAAQVLLESSGGTGAALASGATAAGAAATVGGAVAGLPGAIAGAKYGFFTGSATATAIYSFGQYLKGEMEPFRDPQTGIIDYDAVYNDSKLVAKIRAKAARYGVTMALFDTVGTKLAGMFISKPIEKIVKQGVQKATVGAAAKGLSKGALVQGAQEGVGEVSAQLAAEGTDTTLGKFAGFLGEGALEFGFGIVTGGAIEVAGGLARTSVAQITSSAKAKAKTTVTKVKESNKSTEDFNNLQNTREKLAESPEAEQSPEAVKTLVDEALAPEQRPTAVPPSPVEPLTEVEAEAAAFDLEQEVDENNIAISPKEWEAFFKSKGVDPVEVLSRFGEQVVDEYNRNKAFDGSVNVSHGEWLSLTNDYPELDAIARVNGADLNAVEAAEQIDEITQNPFTLFEPKTPGDFTIEPGEGAEVEPVTGQPGLVTQYTEVTDEDTGEVTSTVMRPVDVVSQFRSEDEKTTLNSVKTRMRKALKDSAIPTEAVDIVAELQFRHMRARARRLGVSIAQLNQQIKFGKTSEEFTNGAFSASGLGDPFAPFRIVFNPQNVMTKTLVHELGHSWLYEMSQDWQFISSLDEASMTPDQKEYKQIMMDTADLLGFETIDQLYADPTKTTRAQETFAQTTEKYFLEGKFADSRVRGIMESFRKYMVAIAEFVAKSYPQFPPLMISPRVERLFEVLLDTQDKMEQEVYTAFPSVLADTEILGKDAEKYMETYRLALSEAIANFYGKIYRMNIADREAAIDKALNDIYDEATQLVDAKPSMRLLKMFQREGAEKISYESFMRLFADNDEAIADKIKAQLPKEFVASKKKGGVDAETIMSVTGINDPDMFVNLMIEAKKRDALIEEQANQLAKDRFPIMRTDEEIHEAAVKAVNGRGRERLLADEFKIIANKYLGTLKGTVKKIAMPAGMADKMAKDKIKGKALALVSGARLQKFSARKFLRDSNRLGREAARRFVRGDLELAFHNKHQEAVQFYAYQYGLEAIKEVAKTRQLIKRFGQFITNTDQAKTLDVDLMKFGLEVINAVRTGGRIPGYVKGPLVDDGLAEIINNRINSLIVDTQGRTGDDISVGSYILLGELLGSIRFAAARTKEVELEARKANKLAVGEAIVTEVGPRKKSDPEREKDAWTTAYVIETRSVNTELASLFPNDLAYAQSTLGKLMAGIQQAEALRNEAMEKYRNSIKKAIMEVSKGDSVMSALLLPITRRMPGLKTYNKYARPVFAPDLGPAGHRFNNVLEILMTLLHMGSESGQKKLIMGMGWGQIDPVTGELDASQYWKFIDKLVEDKYLQKKHFDLLQTIWDIYEELHPLAKQSLRITDGTDMGHIKPKTMKTAFGDYKGGYVPVMPTEIEMDAGVFDVDNRHYPASYLYPVMNTSFSKQRSDSYYEVDLDMSKLLSSISAVANVAYLRVPLFSFGQVMKLDNVRESLETRRPGIVTRQIAPWFDRVKMQQFTVPSELLRNRLARGLRNRVAVQFFFGNLRVVAKQLTGLAPLVRRTGASNIVNALYLMGSNPRAIYEEATSKSAVMRQRLKVSQEQALRSWDKLDTNFDWLNWTEDKVQMATYLPIQLMQNIVDLAGWKAGYEKAKMEGLSEREAINFANNAVKETQGDNTVSSLSNFQFGTDIERLFTQLTTYSMTIGAQAGNDFLRNETNARRARALLAWGTFSLVIPALISKEIDELGKEEDDETKKMTDEQKQAKWWNDRAIRVATEGIDSLLPVVGKVITGPMLGFDVSVSPAIDQLENIGTAIKGAKMNANNIEMTPAEVSATMNTLGLFIHPSLIAAGKGLRLVEDSETEGERKTRERVRRRQLEALRRSNR